MSRRVSLKEMPKEAIAVWCVALVLALIGATLMILDWTEVFQTKTWVQLLPITAATLINTCLNCKYIKKNC